MTLKKELPRSCHGKRHERKVRAVAHFVWKLLKLKRSSSPLLTDLVLKSY